MIVHPGHLGVCIRCLSITMQTNLPGESRDGSLVCLYCEAISIGANCFGIVERQFQQW